MIENSVPLPAFMIDDPTCQYPEQAYSIHFTADQIKFRFLLPHDIHHMLTLTGYDDLISRCTSREAMEADNLSIRKYYAMEPHAVNHCMVIESSYDRATLCQDEAVKLHQGDFHVVPFTYGQIAASVKDNAKDDMPPDQLSSAYKFLVDCGHATDALSELETMENRLTSLQARIFTQFAREKNFCVIARYRGATNGTAYSKTVRPQDLEPDRRIAHTAPLRHALAYINLWQAVQDEPLTYEELDVLTQMIIANDVYKPKYNFMKKPAQ